MKVLKESAGIIDENIATQISSSLGISNLTARLLIKRGITDLESAKKFLYPNKEDLLDPYLLNDMDKAVAAIKKHIEKGSRICILGDYDVDGVTSTALLYTALKEMGTEVSFYIPSRQDEGYGLTMASLENVMAKKPDLVITVDCGVTSVYEVQELYRRNVEVIVTDHHKCLDILPECEAVVNPNRLDSVYPFKSLAGVGVVSKLVQALLGKEYMHKYSDMIALGTIADLMPVLSENRIYISEGLARINSEKCNKGIMSLVSVSGLNGKKLNARDIAFMLSPRINAGGRLDNNSKSVELLIESDQSKLDEISANLNELNSKRQQIVNNIYKNALAKLEAKKDLYNDYAIILADSTYNHSVIGIVASKLVEQFNRPVIIFAEEEGVLVGSARSINGIDIHKVLSSCSDLYTRFGGHEQAAGLTLKAEYYGDFISRINNYIKENVKSSVFIPSVTYDLKLNIKDINESFINELNLLEPFGMQNPIPVFYINGELIEAKKIGSDKTHLRFVLSEDDNKKISGVAFSAGYLADEAETRQNADIIARAEINEWNGSKSVQLNASYIDFKRNFDTNLFENMSFRFFNAKLDNIIYNYNVTHKIRHDYKTITKKEICDIFNSNIWNNVIFCGSYEAAEFIKNYVLTDIVYYNEYIGYLSSKDLLYNSVVYAPLFEKMQYIWFNNAVYIDCEPVEDISQNIYYLRLKDEEKTTADRDNLLKCYIALKKAAAFKGYSTYKQIYDEVFIYDSSIDKNLFYTSVKVFKELKLIEIENASSINIKIKNGVKTDLQNSILYKAINNISR